MLLDTVTVEVEGLNFEKLINKLNNYFVIYNLERPELKKIKFEIKQNCLKKMFSVIDTKCYTINVLKQSTFKTLFNTILYRIGLIIGLVCFVTFLIAFSNVTFSYKVYGLNTITYDLVEQKLADFGIKKGKINHFKNAELEQYLLNEMPNISLVSVMQKGNAILINIKETEDSIDTTLSDIVAPRNMLIESINLVSGTLVKKVGDSVFMGESIVKPYYIDSFGVKHSCKAIATIVSKTWFSGTCESFKKVESIKRTGKSVTLCKYYIGTKCVGTNKKANNFDSFEIVSSTTQIFKNLYLPFVVEKTTYYETEKVFLNNDTNNLIELAKIDSMNKAQLMVPSGYKITSVSVQVIELDDKVIVQTNLESNIRIN